jgi:hypothetical protein
LCLVFPVGFEDQTYPTLISFYHEYTVIEMHKSYVANTSLGGVLVTASQGYWKETSQNDTFQVELAFFVQGAPGNEEHGGEVIGTQVTFLTLTLDQDTLSGPFNTTVLDPDRVELFSATGFYNVTRFT